MENTALSEEEKMETDNDCDYEPFDTKKENFINQDLMDQLDRQLVSTIHLRKTCPSRVKSKLKKLFRLELKHIAKITLEESKESNICEANIHQDGLNRETVEERLRDTSASMTEINANCKEMLAKTKELVKAVEINKKCENSDFNRMLSETPPTTPDTMDTDSPCFTEKHLNTFVNRKLHV